MIECLIGFCSCFLGFDIHPVTTVILSIRKPDAPCVGNGKSISTRLNGFPGEFSNNVPSGYTSLNSTPLVVTGDTIAVARELK